MRCLDYKTTTDAGVLVQTAVLVRNVVCRSCEEFIWPARWQDKVLRVTIQQALLLDVV